MISPQETVLFQGDSITDAYRDRDCPLPNTINGLAGGYAGMIASRLVAERPLEGLKFYNRGVSGDRVADLVARCQRDILVLRPNLLSVLVGVNDVGIQSTSYPSTPGILFEKAYRLLLETTYSELPGTKLVLCEPFGIKMGILDQTWLDELEERASLVRELASEFQAKLIPFQELFDHLCSNGSEKIWLHDGIHPTPAGHTKMAQFWIEQVAA